jgi:hypothetical protein
MRTTINIDERLLIEVKTAAAQSGRTLTAVIEDALRTAMAARRTREDVHPVRLPTHRGGGLQPGVDLDDTAALIDLMDGRTG